MKTLEEMTSAEFEALASDRVHRMCKLLGADYVTNPTGDQWQHFRELCESQAFCVHFHNRSIFDIYDETTQVIGSDWIWHFQRVYFAREADAVWFTLRWCD